MANNDYITTDCKLTVSKNTAKLDEEIFLYKNDRNIKLLIEIVDNKYRYKSDDLSNLLVKYKASYAQVKWYKNAEVKKEFPIQATDDGKVVFVIEGQLIDEDTELGDYDLQLRLLNESQESIRSLPIIKGAVHILKPLFEEGDIATVNSAVADVSMLSLDGDAIDTYNSDGTYNQTNWGNGDVISSAKLNKLEKVAKDNVDKVNKMPAKSIVEGGKIYLAKEDGTKLDSGTELPAGGSTIEVVNNLESDSTTAALSAAQGKVLNTQYKDIANKIKDINPGGGQELSQTDIYERARGKVNLFIETPFEGGNQPYHPSVVAFDSTWNGYKYWMAYTPYPYGNDPAENPCIVASNDLLYWEEPRGITNPIDSPSQATDLGITYWSDTELIYNSADNKLECWYRGIGSTNLWVRKTSSDGVTWGTREILHTFSGTGTVSASVILENGTYKIWIMSPNLYYTTTDVTNWGTGTSFTTEDTNYWHFQVKKTSKGYEMFAHINWPDNLSIVHLVSTDGITFKNTKKIISSNGDMHKPYGIDAKGIYRPCFIVLNDRYYLFYCTGANDIRKGITLSISNNLDLNTFRGIDANDEQYMKKPTKLSKYGFERLIFNKDDNSLYYCPLPITDKNQSCTWIKIGSSSSSEDESGVQIGYLDSTGNFKSSANGFVMDYTKVTANSNYSVTDTSSKATSCKVAEYDNNKNFIKRDILIWDNYSTEFTTSSNAAYIRVMFDYMNAQTSDANYITITKNNKYSITNNLTNCITNNSITSVDKNASYTSTISANNGYTLSSITVTMGGVDITSTAVTENTINISSVTGNIIITANAILSSGDKEVDISNVTWVNGYINSSGTVANSNAGQVSDFIQLESGVTYVITDTNNYVSNIKIAEYDNSKALVQRQIDKFDNSTHSTTVTLSSTTAYIRISIEISNGSIDSNAKNYIAITKI